MASCLVAETRRDNNLANGRVAPRGQRHPRPQPRLRSGSDPPPEKDCGKSRFVFKTRARHDSASAYTSPLCVTPHARGHTRDTNHVTGAGPDLGRPQHLSRPHHQSRQRCGPAHVSRLQGPLHRRRGEESRSERTRLRGCGPVRGHVASLPGAS
eukprot:2229451-Rhodomonas_salina.1